MPRRTTTRSATAPILALALVTAAGCGGGSDDADPDTPPAPAPDSTALEGPPSGAARPDSRTDTISIEGMAEPIELRLFRSPVDFPLPFTAYVPTAMRPEVEEAGARFVAAFGGTVNTDAFVHLFVFPPGTDRQGAVDAARAYKTGPGVPVSQGLEPMAGETRTPPMDWAIEAYRFEYQSGGDWYGGTIGVGRHGDRFFQIIRHYPLEYVDGFPPRAGLILETWLWAAGSPLGAGPG